jgi:hypothetical protein
MSTLFVNGETGAVGIGTSAPSAMVQVLTNFAATQSVSIDQTVVGQEFPPAAASFAADYTDTVASIDTTFVATVEYPPPTVPFTANSMTVAGAPYGNGAYVASASSAYAGQPASTVFDKMTGTTIDSTWANATAAYNTTTGAAATTYQTTGTDATGSTVTYNGEWVQLQLPSAIVLRSYSLQNFKDRTLARAPKKWVLLGSTNGSSWQYLDDESNITAFGLLYRELTFNVTNAANAAYSYFRLVVQEIQPSNDGYVNVRQWRLFADSTLPVTKEFPPAPMTAADTVVATGYGAGLYSARASSEYDATTYAAWRAFDKSTTYYETTSIYTAATGIYTGTVVTYDTANTAYRGEWLQIRLPEPIVLTSFALTTNTVINRAPRTFSILGSLNGDTWTLVQTQTDITTWVASTAKTFTVTGNTMYYSYYRIVVLRTGVADSGMANANYLDLLEWRLFGDVTTTYPKYKCSLTAAQTPYAPGVYSIYANSMYNPTFADEANPAGLFDKTAGKAWATCAATYTSNVDASPAPTVYVQLPDAIKVSSYALTARGAAEAPNKWTLYGSNVASGWQVLDVETGVVSWAAGERKAFAVSGAGYYSVYRLDLLRNASATAARIALAEIQLYGDKQTNEARLAVGNSGQLAAGTSTISGNVTLAGDLYLSGIIGNALMRSGPYVAFDGSAENKATFLQWLQYVTSTQYRLNYQPDLPLARRTWWSAGVADDVQVYNTYVYTNGTGTTGNYAYYGSVLAPDGRVVFVPQNATTIATFNPSTNTYATVPGITTAGSSAYAGGVLLPDGRIVFIPRTATTIGIFNPKNSTFTAIPYTRPSADAFFGGTLLPDGRVFFSPTYQSTTIGLFNPADNSYATVTISVTLSGSTAYMGCVLIPDGRVVMVPNSATAIGIFTPTTNLFTTVPGITMPGSDAYGGGVLLPDGRVFFVPRASTTYAIFDPIALTLLTIPGAPGGIAYTGGVLLPDGRVMCIPCSATSFAIVNPTTLAVSTGSGAPGTGAHIGGVLIPDGRIICAPSTTTTVGIIVPTVQPRPPVPEMCYHPCFNKF